MPARARTIILPGLLVLLLHGISYGATIYVPDDHATIQGAIDAAAAGDTIVVRAGTYVENIDFAGKAVTVKSADGPDSTIIDGSQPSSNNRSVATFENGESRNSVLDGFTLTNGTGKYEPLQSNYLGGGIYCDYSSPTIINNIIRRNFASESVSGSGGGIYCWGSSPFIANNIIMNNTADSYGGGIYCGHAFPVIANNVFYENRTGAWGGGIFMYDCSPVALINNTVWGNRAWDEGGGIHLKNSDATIANTILWDNYADSGPAVFLAEGYSGEPSILTIRHCDVDGGQASIAKEPACSVNWGPGMIDVHPRLIDTANFDFHLTADSPCRNAGDDTVLPPEITVDFEGDPRIAGASVDIGADESWIHLYHTGRAAPGGSISIRVVGSPGEPVVLCLGSGVQDPPQPTMYGDLYLELPLRNKWSLGDVPTYGVLIWTKAIPSGAVPGGAYPLQALIGPPGDPGSKLSNLDVLVVVP